MDYSDVLISHPELATEEEIEDWNRELFENIIDTTPSWWNSFTMGLSGIQPDAEYRSAFESRRQPAMGLTNIQLDMLEQHVNHPQLHPSQKRTLLSLVRSQMMRSLISPNRCSTVADCVTVLRKELESGVCASVPDWYKFSTVTMGKRKIGYDECCNRGCWNTETVDHKFLKCSRCKLPFYCGVACQKQDWKVRHKKLCAAASTQGTQLSSATKFLRMMMGGVNGDSVDEIKQKKAHLKAEKVRGGRGKKKKNKKKKMKKDEEEE